MTVRNAVVDDLIVTYVDSHPTPILIQEPAIRNIYFTDHRNKLSMPYVIFWQTNGGLALAFANENIVDLHSRVYRPPLSNFLGPYRICLGADGSEGRTFKYFKENVTTFWRTQFEGWPNGYFWWKIKSKYLPSRILKTNWGHCETLGKALSVSRT